MNKLKQSLGFRHHLPRFTQKCLNRQLEPWLVQFWPTGAHKIPLFLISYNLWDGAWWLLTFLWFFGVSLLNCPPPICGRLNLCSVCATKSPWLANWPCPPRPERNWVNEFPVPKGLENSLNWKFGVKGILKDGALKPAPPPPCLSSATSALLAIAGSLASWMKPSKSIPLIKPASAGLLGWVRCFDVSMG